VFIGGFGQGATVSIAAYLSYSQGVLGGVISSGGLMCANINWERINVQEKKKVPVLLHHGANDNVHSLSYAKATYKLL
jgi:predicted esterase